MATRTLQSNMISPTYDNFIHYLSAKVSVDDRALNYHVWQRLKQELQTFPLEKPLRILEIGAGIGTMIARLLAQDMLPGNAHITAIDANASVIAVARQRLPQWATACGFAPSVRGGLLKLQRGEQRIAVNLQVADLFDFVRRRHRYPWDLVLAHAFLDLVDVPATLPLIFRLLHPGALFYFTLNFDGVTALEPPVDPELEAQIEVLYHQTMDERRVGGKPSGDSRTGRHLFHHLRRAGGQILAAGSSDWVVFADADGYPADEAYFLHFIIDTIGAALKGHPLLDSRRFSAWLAARHEQIARGELVYIAHQIDLVGRVRG